MSSRRKAIPTDSLLQLRQRLDRLPPKSPERAAQITAMALLYCISVTTVYRTLRAFQKPHIAHRRDHGKPRILPPSELEYYCELIAALKLRTTNKAGRHLSTTRAIQLLEEHGVETTQGLVKRHCCKVSDEAAFCLIQRPYISKTLLTRRISPRGSP